MQIIDLLDKTQDQLYDMVIAEANKKTDGARVIEGDWKEFIIVKGDIPINLVAHLDVAGIVPRREDIIQLDNMIMLSPSVDYRTVLGGDNRCGVWILLQWLAQPKEKRPTLIFTTDEEIGCIGARALADSHIALEVCDANFCLQFDRRGFNEVVFYDVAGKGFKDFILSFGFKHEIGSFSDIATLCPALGMAGCNISSGFYDEHTSEEYISVGSMEYAYRMSKYIVNVGAEEDKHYDCPAKYDYGYGYGKTEMQSARYDEELSEEEEMSMLVAWADQQAEADAESIDKGVFTCDSCAMNYEASERAYEIGYARICYYCYEGMHLHTPEVNIDSKD